MPLAPEIAAFGDGVHDPGATGLSITGAGFGPFAGSAHIYQNIDRTGNTDALTVGTWGEMTLSGVEIPAVPNNANGYVYLFVQREDLAWSQGSRFTLGPAIVVAPAAAAPAPAGVKSRSRVSRYPRTIVVGGKRYYVRNAREEQGILRQYIEEQERAQQKAQEVENAALAKQAKRRFRYTTTRFEKVSVRRKQELRRIDEELITLMVA